MSMIKRRCLAVILGLSLATLCTGGAADEGAGESQPQSAEPEDAVYDVVLLVDASQEMATLSRKSAHVVTEAMTDAHRLAIMTFGTEVRVLQTLGRIATVDEKAAALRTLTDAAFDAESVSLRQGLTGALEHLEKRSTPRAHKVVVLLSGAAPSSDDARDIAAIKTEIAPRYLANGVVLHVVTLPSPRVELLQAAANLTGGKCLAAVNVETMTDALDMIVDQLRPPERVVVTKEVPVPAKTPSAGKAVSPDKRLKTIERDTRSTFITGGFAAAIILLLAWILVQLHSLKKGTPERAAVAKSDEKAKGKSGFAKLRDLANSLGNLIVDAKEMSESLNLDLEDFGVETWKEQRALDERYRDFARSIFLVIDHLEVQPESSGKGASWVAEKLRRTLAEEGIEEIAVSRGDAFDSLYHKHIEERESNLKPGVVLDVLRKGYLKRSPGKGEAVSVLRQAEVVVSRGTQKGGAGESAASTDKEA